MKCWIFTEAAKSDEPVTQDPSIERLTDDMGQTWTNYLQLYSWQSNTECQKTYVCT